MNAAATLLPKLHAPPHASLPNPPPHVVEVGIVGLQCNGTAKGRHSSRIVSQPVTHDAGVVVRIRGGGVQGKGRLVVSQRRGVIAQL